MRIQHNILAMNAYRNYNTNTSALAKNLEKLSSGYKINRAGDDAAGLAISEKMRAQITGLNAAQKNVKDGISLVKTAEGAMQEIQDMLNRMDYLATQSANGTYDNDVDRKNLQKEVDALKSEINRIAESANFNGIKLLNGGNVGTTSTQDVTDVQGGNKVVVTPIKDGKDAGRDPAAGVYEYDLSNWNVTASKAVTAGSLKFTVGGKTVATVAAAKNTGDKIRVTDITATSGEFSIGGNKFKAEITGNKLVLTMKKAPTSEFKTNMAMTVSAPNSKGNQGEMIAANIVQEAISEDAYKYAQGSFDLAKLGATITDGSQIAIGGTVYTFKLNKEDSAADGKQNVVDISYLAKADKAKASKVGIAAAKALSNVAKDNAVFKVTSDNNSSKIYLTERLSENKPYKNDMVGTSTNSKDANWDNLVKFDVDGKMTGVNVGQVITASGLHLQIGDTADSYNQLDIAIGDMRCSALGIGTLDISSQNGAQNAIQLIKNAINTVSGVRGDLGAYQNRLEHTQNNLSVMAENIQDAESSIRDTDVAEEMMAYTKNNILIQSAQAMLAQANAVPQGVLQLLG